MVVKSKHQIQDKWLEAALCYHEDVKDLPEFARGKFSYTRGKGGWGHLYLLTVIRFALNLQRLPGCEDRVFMEKAAKEYREWFATECLKHLPASIEAFHEVYQACQVHLRERHPDGMITLYRSVKHVYARVLVERIQKAKKAGETTVQMVMDTINGFCSAPKRYADSYYVEIKLQVPIEEVVLCAPCVKGMEEDEYVLLNRNPTGQVTLHFDELTLHTSGHLSLQEENEAKSLPTPFFISALPLEALSQEKQISLLDQQVAALREELGNTFDRRLKRWSARIWKR